MNHKTVTVNFICLLYGYGCKEISLKSSDILEYVPILEKIFKSNGTFEKCDVLSDYFVRTPVSESYDHFSDLLLETVIGCELGTYNERYDSIELDINAWQLKKAKEATSGVEQEAVAEFINIYNERCNKVSSYKMKKEIS